MITNLIIGGNLAGLITATVASRSGESTLVLDKVNRVGGQAFLNQQRLYSPSSVEFIKGVVGESDWIRVEDAAHERRKGQWCPITIDKNALDAEEQFFLGAPFFRPRRGFSDIGSRLAGKLKEASLIQEQVEEIDGENHRIFCLGGEEYAYDRLIWCDDLESLLRVYRGTAPPQLTLSKKQPSIKHALDLQLELTEPLFAYSNSVLFSFRYKERRYNAIGTSSAPQANHQGSRVDWILLLEPEVGDDREEMAKCVRAMKRELFREFPELSTLKKSERLVYLGPLSIRHRAMASTLEILPSVFYVGPEARLPSEAVELQSLDLTLANCHIFANQFASRCQSA